MSELKIARGYRIKQNMHVGKTVKSLSVFICNFHRGKFHVTKIQLIFGRWVHKSFNKVDEYSHRAISDFKNV